MDYLTPDEKHELKEQEALFSLWKLLAARGNAEAQFRLGLLYREAALYWLRRAAAQGHSEACTELQNNG